MNINKFIANVSSLLGIISLSLIISTNFHKGLTKSPWVIVVASTLLVVLILLLIFRKKIQEFFERKNNQKRTIFYNYQKVHLQVLDTPGRQANFMMEVSHIRKRRNYFNTPKIKESEFTLLSGKISSTISAYNSGWNLNHYRNDLLWIYAIDSKKRKPMNIIRKNMHNDEVHRIEMHLEDAFTDNVESWSIVTEHFVKRYEMIVELPCEEKEPDGINLYEVNPSTFEKTRTLYNPTWKKAHNKIQITVIITNLFKDKGYLLEWVWDEEKLNYTETATLNE